MILTYGLDPFSGVRPIVWNSPAEILPDLWEEVSDRALDDVLAATPDVPLLWQHDPSNDPNEQRWFKHLCQIRLPLHAIVAELEFLFDARIDLPLRLMQAVEITVLSEIGRIEGNMEVDPSNKFVGAVPSTS
jgi:hypothetical protein